MTNEKGQELIDKVFKIHSDLDNKNQIKIGDNLVISKVK